MKQLIIALFALLSINASAQTLSDRVEETIVKPLEKYGIHFTRSETSFYHRYIIIFIWTGYTFEELVYAFDPTNNVLAIQECIMLEMCLRWSDVIIDGRFEKELRDITLPLRGSSNQRVIDTHKTFRLGKIVECEEYLNSEV